MKDKGVELVVYVGPVPEHRQAPAGDGAAGLRARGLPPGRHDLRRGLRRAGRLARRRARSSTPRPTLFDDLKNKEMALYRSWLDQVSPGAVPNYYGLYAWSAARLFVEEAVALGGKLDRAALVAAHRKGVKDWTGNGLHVPQQVGAKHDLQLRLDHPAQRRQVEPGLRQRASCAALSSTGWRLTQLDMSSFIAYTIFGLFSGAAYAIAASGLVLTYTTTRVFNIAHGAFGMVLSFLFWDFSVRQGLPIWLSLILVLFVVAPVDRLVHLAVRGPRSRRGAGQRRRWSSPSRCSSGCIGCRDAGLQARGAHRPALLPRDELRARRDQHHRPPADHDPDLDRRGRSRSTCC